MPSLNIMKFKFGLSFACGVEPRTVGPVRCRRIVQRKPQGQRGLQLPRVAQFVWRILGNLRVLPGLHGKSRQLQFDAT